MKSFVFPGQGSQFSGMGKDLYESSEPAKRIFESANEVLGFDLTEVMFSGSDEDLKQTHITQPAVFVHSCALLEANKDRFEPSMVAGHSLGEFSALVASGALRFEDALVLVSKRAQAMQKACELKPSTMAAILGLEDEVVKEVCDGIGGTVVAANFNSPGQVVISGEVDAVNKACAVLTEKGAKRALVLPVGGAFHSPLMEPARQELSEAISTTDFSDPVCPVYQNVTGTPVTSSLEIKENLNKQLTAPVLWTQTMMNMIQDGATSLTEVGPGKVLQGLIKKIDRRFPTDAF